MPMKEKYFFCCLGFSFCLFVGVCFFFCFGVFLYLKSINLKDKKEA